MSILDSARQAIAAGLCVLPPRQDGAKAPIESWRKYQHTRSSTQDLARWYGAGTLTGLGLVTGEISGGLECFEFDSLDAYEQLLSEAASSGYTELIHRITQGYSERTPNGIHWLYRCEVIGENTKLASADDGKTLIETRGEGGFVIVAPSSGGVHPSGKPYELIAGGFDSIATISPGERETLFELARCLHRGVPRASEAARIPAATTLRLVEGERERPGDEFASATSWAEILEPHGWRIEFTDREGATHWTRPGKEHGTSATTNYRGADTLKVFSSNAWPLEEGRTYSKFGAYSVLNHRGDYREAAKVLRPVQSQLSHPGPEHPALQAIEKHETSPKTLSDYLMTSDELGSLKPPAWLVDGMVPEGSLGVIWGKPGSFKSFFAVDLALSVATGRWFHGAKVTTAQGALYVASEGSAGLGSRVKAWSERSGLHNHGEMRWLPRAVDLQDEDTAAQLIEIASQRKPALIVVDTLARSMSGDENSSQDLGAVIRVAEILREVSGAAVLIVHHPGKAGESMRGSSALRGAIDVEIEMRRNGGVVTAANRKQKDAEEFSPLRLEAEKVGESLVLTRSSRDPLSDTIDPEILHRLTVMFTHAFGRIGATPAQLREAVAGELGLDSYQYYCALNQLIEGGEMYLNPKGKLSRADL